MPRTNIDYSNTIIYKLCCKDINITEIYVGHTTDMRKRKNKHKSVCYNEKAKGYNCNIYQFIRANGGFQNWDIIEIERFEAIDGNDARKRERYWVEELKATLNMVIPSRSGKEWEEDNKEKRFQQAKEYVKNNEDKIKEYNKEYRQTHKEYFNEKAKEYYKRNREIRNTKNKEYREINKEKEKEKIECECGCVVSNGWLLRHKKTQKHIDLMVQKESNE